MKMAVANLQEVKATKSRTQKLMQVQMRGEWVPLAAKAKEKCQTEGEKL
jgi:hypothetical protein